MNLQESKTPFVVLGAGIVALVLAVALVVGFAAANTSPGDDNKDPARGDTIPDSATEPAGGASTATVVPAPATVTATPPPSRTPTVTPSPTPTRSPTVTPAPSALLVPLPSASSGGGSVRGTRTGVFGIVLAAAEQEANTGNGRIQVNAYIPTIGSLEHPVATAWLDRPFFVPTNLGATVEARFSGKVDWTGVVAGNGAAGAGGEISIVLKVLDGSRVVAQLPVLSREVRESALSAGGLPIRGSSSPTLSANVVGGRTYVLRLEASCEATSGLLGAATHCIFGQSATYGAGFVHWGGFEVELIP